MGEILSLQRRPVTVELDAVYEEIGVRSFGRGIFHKEPVGGADLGNKRVFWIKPSDLVISNVFAWEGAVAVASNAETGKIGSHRFMTFVPTDARVETSWAGWFFRSQPGLDLIRRASPGSAGRNRTLAIDRFEALEIPLPPVGEQRRISDRLDRVDVAARKLELQAEFASDLVSALAVSISARPDLSEEEKSSAGWRRVALGSAMTLADAQVVVDPNESYPNVGIFSFGRGMFAKAEISGAMTSARTLNRIRAGQFIYSRLFAFEGAYSFVPPAFDGFFVSSEFPAFDADPKQLDAKWLASYLRSPARWAELRGSSKGLGVRRQRVPTDALLAFQIWLPPIQEQRDMVDAIDRLDTAQANRKRSEERIRSLIASSLNEAFARLS